MELLATPVVVIGDEIASAFYSHDFEWECLREEVENNVSVGGRMTSLEVGKGGDDACEEDMSAVSWNAFHRRHSTALFFKERRYLLKEFPELMEQGNPLLVLEVGCGTGSSVIPILRGNSSAHVYACDCSLAALEKARVAVDSQAGLTTLLGDRFHPFLCDLPVQKLPDWLCCTECRRSFETPLLTVSQQQETFQNMIATTGPHKFVDSCCHGATAQSSVSTAGVAEEHVADKAVGATSSSAPKNSPSCERCLGGVDVVTLVFTLSAIHPEVMPSVLKQVYAAMKRGGILLFRDYGLYDMTMLRFPAGQKVGDRLYRRMDGTLCYYFSCDVLRHVMAEAGFVEDEVDFCCVELVNRKKQRPMKRVWVHGKFRKPEAL